ncbi:MAG: FliH/SctL family protein, partial [Planctomycetota bacterium]
PPRHPPPPMPILKQQAAQPLIRDAVVLDLGDLGRQAARLRAAAETKAQQILENARDQAQEIIAAAEKIGHDRGHEQGLAQGLAEGQTQGHAQALADAADQIKALTQSLSTVAQAWDERRAELDREARTAVLDFALKFAHKITHRVLDTDPHVVIDQVAAALARVLEPTDVRLHVHPDDRDTLQEVLPDLLAGLGHLQTVELTDDPAVGRGGCKLALRGGEVDAAIDTQIARLIDTVRPAPPPESPETGAPTS